MKIKDLEFKLVRDLDSDQLYVCKIGNITLTVLDRLTGFSGGLRDIETGFKDSNDLMWIAFGDFDIREFPELELWEAIEKIKENANTCRGI